MFDGGQNAQRRKASFSSPFFGRGYVLTQSARLLAQLEGGLNREGYTGVVNGVILPILLPGVMRDPRLKEKWDGLRKLQEEEYKAAEQGWSRLDGRDSGFRRAELDYRQAQARWFFANEAMTELGITTAIRKQGADEEEAGWPEAL